MSILVYSFCVTNFSVFHCTVDAELLIVNSVLKCSIESKFKKFGAFNFKFGRQLILEKKSKQLTKLSCSQLSDVKWTHTLIELKAITHSVVHSPFVCPSFNGCG